MEFGGEVGGGQMELKTEKFKGQKPGMKWGSLNM